METQINKFPQSQHRGAALAQRDTPGGEFDLGSHLPAYAHL